MTDLTERRSRLKDEFIRVLGYWEPACGQLLEASPTYFEAYLDYAAVPWRTGTLAPKVREFIYITLNASTTHLYEPALRVHVANALRLGATREEVLAVLQTISILGIHSMALAMPILLEEAKAAGREIDPARLSPRQAALKEEFARTRGYWPATWDGMVALAPDFMAANERLGAVALAEGVLEPKVRQFVLIAVDASTTHLWASGVRTHVRAALREGATVEEIVEVLELTAVLGLQSVAFGLPILNEELARLARPAPRP